MSKDTRTIVIDSISRLEQALLDGKLVSTLSSHKTVGVVFQLRVPRKMRAGEIKALAALGRVADQLATVAEGIAKMVLSLNGHL